MPMVWLAADFTEKMMSLMNDRNIECKHGLKLGSCRACKEPATPLKRRARVTSGTSSQGRRTEQNSDEYFNHTWFEWNQMRDVGLTFLQRIATTGTTVTYEQFWTAVRNGVGRDIGKPWRQIPQLLRHVGENSFDDCGLVITALVVTEDREPSPSEGFFRLAARLELIPESESPAKGVKWLGMTKPQREFWREHKTSLYEYFAR